MRGHGVHVLGGELAGGVVVLILRARIRRFFEVLDAEAVGLFQVVFYLWFIAGALYLLFLTTTPSATIDASLPPPIAGGWAVSMLVGPLLCVGGKAAHGGLAYTGMLAQFVGDVVCGGAILTYMTAVAAGSCSGSSSRRRRQARSGVEEDARHAAEAPHGEG